MLRRLARWQGPRPDPQGTRLCVAWAELMAPGDDAEARPPTLGIFCLLEAGEWDLFPGFASLTGKEQPSPGRWSLGGATTVSLWRVPEPEGWLALPVSTPAGSPGASDDGFSPVTRREGGSSSLGASRVWGAGLCSSSFSGPGARGLPPASWPVGNSTH